MARVRAGFVVCESAVVTWITLTPIPPRVRFVSSSMPNTPGARGDASTTAP